MSLDPMVDKGAFVHMIDDFVDTLDLDSFGFDNAKLNKEGSSPYRLSAFMEALFICLSAWLKIQ